LGSFLNFQQIGFLTEGRSKQLTTTTTMTTAAVKPMLKKVDKQGWELK